MTLRVNFDDLYIEDENTLVIPTESGTFRLKNPYLSSITFPGLECDCSQSVTIVGNSKLWK